MSGFFKKKRGLITLISGIGAFVCMSFGIGMNKYYEKKEEEKTIVQEHEVKSVGKSFKNIEWTQDLVKKVKDIAKGDYKHVISSLKTPTEVAIYCNHVLKYESDEKVYGRSDYWASFKRIHRSKKDDCDGGALAAAAILSDDGYPSYLLWMESKDGAHLAFLYKTDDGFGSLGINHSDIQEPKHQTVEDLVKAIDEEYKSHKIYDISKRFPDFVDNDKNNDMNP